MRRQYAARALFTVCLLYAALPPLRAAAAAEPPATEAPGEPLTIVVQAPEPRYVAPTRRDRIGRVWAPVLINGKGPFRLVFDTGATRSGVTAQVAEALGIVPDTARLLRLRGVTGASIVPTVHVDRVEVGDLLLQPATLPILADAFGGAEGVLGTEAIGDKRVRIEFRRDRITIVRSHNERAAEGYFALPLDRGRGRFPVVDAYLGRVRIKAIFDTGAQTTIGNLALRDALNRRRPGTATVDEIIGATLDRQEGEGQAAPPIRIGSITIRAAHVTFGDMHIFEYWKLTDEPALLIGMDAIGQLDTLIIDYRRHELQLKLVDG
jgi:predicted aspartyl protease